jgi:hypothetical protein
MPQCWFSSIQKCASPQMPSECLCEDRIVARDGVGSSEDTVTHGSTQMHCNSAYLSTGFFAETDITNSIGLC